MSRTALSGLLVVALEQAVAAPLATSRLADAGARVVKLERPAGDFARRYDSHVGGESSYFVWLNRDKQSCRVDLTAEEDRALVRRLLASADVFVQNLGPGATGRLGLDAPTLRAAHPRLITCDIAGFAPGTPDAGRKAYDLTIQAEAGLAGITGTPDGGPSRIGVSLCDIATGLTAHAQILEALVARSLTGEGCAISVSLFDVAAEMMSIPYLSARHGGAPPSRMGLFHPLIAPYGAYRTADGAILLAVQADKEWADLCIRGLGDASLAADPRFVGNEARVANRAAMDARIEPILLSDTTASWSARLAEACIAFGVLSDVEGLARHGALALAQAHIAGHAFDMIAPPAIVDGARAGGGTVPALGEHDELVRAEFG